MRRAAVCGIAIALVAGAGTARAEDGVEHCTGFITSLPVALTGTGTWCLIGDLETSYTGTAVSLSSPRAVIDCKGFAIRSTAAQANYGVHTGTSDRVTIRGCRIVGFDVGIQVGTMQDTNRVAIIEDNIVEGGNRFGIRAEQIADVQIRRNTVLDIGSGSGNGHPTGILVQIQGNAIVHDNTVTGVTGSLVYATWNMSRGISVDAGGRASIVGNIVGGMLPGINGGVGTGILTLAGTDAVIRGNQVTGDGSPKGRGIACSGNAGTVLVGNLVNGAARPTDACPGDAGGQYFPPE